MFMPKIGVNAVTLICATTVCLATIAGFVYLVHLNPSSIDTYLKPAIPALASIGTSLFIWLKVNSTNTNVQNTQTEVKDLTNGKMDAKIQDGIHQAYTELTGKPWPIVPSDTTTPVPPVLPPKDDTNGNAV